MQITDCQPDSGNPTVREERGAYGNVSYGGTRNPRHTPKGCRTETLCLRLRAPYFYPTESLHALASDDGAALYHPVADHGSGAPALSGRQSARPEDWGLADGLLAFAAMLLLPL